MSSLTHDIDYTDSSRQDSDYDSLVHRGSGRTVGHLLKILDPGWSLVTVPRKLTKLKKIYVHVNPLHTLANEQGV